MLNITRIVSLICIITSYLFLHSAGASTLLRNVEPPFWWAGMANTRLQLMVYGDELGDIKVKSSSKLVDVIDVVTAENVRYAFIELQISDKLEPGTVDFLFTTSDGREQIYSYEFKQRIEGSSQRKGFSAKDVIYLVTPDRFSNGDASNDSISGLSETVDRSSPDGRHGGDLHGLIDHLDYLSDLGITKIWLNPLQQNNEPKFSYHGYSISDLYQIDARYGGNQALVELSRQANKRGISLIMDTIPNHIGVNHWWMNDLPTSDWINNSGQFSPTSHSHETIQDPYSTTQERKWFNDGWFVPTMPDLNQRNTHLANYLIQNNIWWIEYAGLSGLRVDTLPYADKNFTSEFTARILSEYPNLNIVGEEWSTNPAIVSYWQKGKLNQDGFDGGVPSLMDFPLQEALIQALTEPEADLQGLRRLHTLLANDFQYPDASNLVVIGDNHDMSRLHTQLNDDAALTKMALTFLMTTRGIPQLFYGTEILMTNTGTDAHGVIRSDFPGGWVGDKTNAKTGKGLSKDALDMQSYVRTLLNWRKNEPAIHHGKLVHYLPKDGVYTYFRSFNDSLIMVVMNKNTSSTKVELSRFYELIGDDKQIITNVIAQSSRSLSEPFKAPAKSVQIFKFKQ